MGGRHDRLDRRTFLRGALVGIGAIAASACGQGATAPSGQAPPAVPPTGTPVPPAPIGASAPAAASTGTTASPTAAAASPTAVTTSPTAAALAPTITREAPVPVSPVAGGVTVSGEWRRLTVEGTVPPRRDHSLTVAGDAGLFYLFGGRAQGAAKDDLWVLDVGAGRWRPISGAGPRPAARFGHEAFWDAGKKRLIVTLGQAGSTFFNDVWAFDPATSAWREIGGSGDRPATRYGAGGAYDAAANRFLITHGFTNQGRFDDTWAFDLASDRWSKVPVAGALPVKRCLARSAWDAAAGRFFLYGGQSNEAPFLGDHWALGGTGNWSELRPASSPGARNLYGASFDPAARRWYLIGGNTPNGRVADAWAFDAGAGDWRPIAVGAEAPAGRFGLDIAHAGGSIYLFGGNDGTADLADTWVLRLTPT